MLYGSESGEARQERHDFVGESEYFSEGKNCIRDRGARSIRFDSDQHEVKQLGTLVMEWGMLSAYA